MKSQPDVFIIESLKFDDEDQKLHEGHLLSKVLRLSGRKPRYYYIRTRQEFEEILDKFKDSGYRYLHISCHANRRGMALTLEDLAISDIQQLLSPVLSGRRVFFSACEVVTQELARALLKGTGCYSLVGPGKTVYFDEAAVYWAAFYHVMLRREAMGMTHSKIFQAACDLQQLMGMRMRYYRASKRDANGYAPVFLPFPSRPATCLDRKR